MKVLRAQSKTLRDLLPEAVMQKLLDAGISRFYADGQIVHERGDEKPGLSIVISGEAVAGNVGNDGSFLVSALLRPGETFGEFTLFAGLPRTHTLWSQGRTEITHVSAKSIEKLFDEEPSLPRALLTLTLMRNHELLDFIDAQRRFSLSARLAKLLLTSLDAEAESGTVECRHEDLAFMLGVSRVAAGKALKRMQADGLVMPRYGRIEVPHIRRLREMVAAEDQFFPLDWA